MEWGVRSGEWGLRSEEWGVGFGLSPQPTFPFPRFLLVIPVKKTRTKAGQVCLVPGSGVFGTAVQVLRGGWPILGLARLKTGAPAWRLAPGRRLLRLFGPAS
jgi:hypothetical protein